MNTDRSRKRKNKKKKIGNEQNDDSESSISEVDNDSDATVKVGNSQPVINASPNYTDLDVTLELENDIPKSTKSGKCV